MWAELVEAGLEPKEARFYLAALSMDTPTVAQVAEVSQISRTNAYDIAKRLAHRGLLSLIEGGGHSGDSQVGSRPRLVVRTVDPQRLLDEWAQKKRVLESLVPQLRALHAKGGLAPRVRHLEGLSGIRTALFETLEWPSPLRGVLSMRDLMAVPGEEAMSEYVAARRERGLWLHVLRSPEKDYPQGWPTSEVDLRKARYVPAEYIFTMTMIIGDEAVAMISSTRENFALVIESDEYVEMQRNLFEVMWAAAAEEPPASPQSENGTAGGDSR
ncbi:TrmB family transcriptional regulator [Rhodococcoides fascians]|uniref:TrmB family transcriptional regulator n=1 Tax=Rhodococcoides fascians TaxID=1828 RepID=UPI000690482C|nr:helix-turn-helix domain-containing protein [Rhodococcus fascians]